MEPSQEQGATAGAVDKSRYWLFHGQDSLEQLDATYIDIVTTIESSTPWVDLGIFLVCTSCEQMVGSHCYHCDTCGKFQLCPLCYDSQVGKRILAQAHEGHKFVHILYRPMTAPLYDGSDLQILEKFAEVRDEESCYLYFPYFFHDCFGMDVWAHRHRAALRAQFSLRPDRGTPLWDYLMMTLDFPTDWYVRRYGSVGWEGLHKNAMDLVVRDHLRAAAMSQNLHKFLIQLQEARSTKEGEYGDGDIPPTESGLSETRGFSAASDMDSKDAQFLAYTFPLQMTTEFNRQLKQSKIIEILPSPEVVESQMSSQALRPLYMLWALLGEEGKPQGWELHGYSSENRAFVLKPTWLAKINEIMEVRRVCFRTNYNDLPAIPIHGSRAFSKLASHAPIGDLSTSCSFSDQNLRKARHFRMKGEYEAAAEILKSLTNVPGPVIAFELQRVYEDQGYFNKDGEYLSFIEPSNLLRGLSLSDGDSELITDERTIYSTPTRHSLMLQLSLVELVRSYHRCFFKGAWLSAMNLAEEVFNEFLKDWRTDCEWDTLSLVYMEIYYHRTVLAACRDQWIYYDPARALSRLGDARNELQKLCRIDEAWDVLQIQLELAKVAHRAQYLESDASFSVTGFRHKEAVALGIVDSFLDLELFKEECNRKLAWAQALLLKSEILYQASRFDEATGCVVDARKVFLRESSTVGVLDTRIALSKQKPITFDELTNVYDELRQRKDLGRLRKLRELRPTSTKSCAADVSEWLDQQRVGQEKLAFEAGDSVAGYRWRLRKYSADAMSGSLFADAEDVLSKADTPLSSLLLTIASFNLANAHLTQGNSLDAALHAVLHDSLMQTGYDAERSQRATLMVLKAFTAAFISKSYNEQVLAFTSLSRLWDGWLSASGLLRWREGGGRCDEVERFIDGACFLPQLAGQMARNRQNGECDESIGKIVLTHLKIAFGLFETLPTYASHLLAPKLAMALGAAAQHTSNLELAARSYHEGIRMCHSGDRVSLATLRLEAGYTLTSLTAKDPEHWHHVLRAGRSLLKAASGSSLETNALEGSLTRYCHSSLALLKSYVAEARGLKYYFERGIPMESQRVQLPGPEDKQQRLQDMFSSREKIRELQEAAYEIFVNVRIVLYKLREELKVSSRYAKMRSLRYIHSGKLAGDIFDNVYEIAWIGTLFCPEDFTDPDSFMPLWTAVQCRKAIILQEETQTFQSRNLLQDIQDNAEALDLYNREQELMNEGKRSDRDQRLLNLRDQMEEIPELKRLLNSRYPTGATPGSLRDLMDVADRTLPQDSHAVLIDWAQYRDYYFIIGYDITHEKILFGELLLRPTVADTQAWVAEHLKCSDRAIRDVLDNERILQSLHELVKPISRHVKPGSLLIFSPAQILHAIPLHAIPLHDPDDFPVIYHHPVVYCPSAAILRNVVLHSLEPREAAFRASLHGLYSTSRSTNDNSIAATLKSLGTRLQDRGMQTSLATGKEVDYSTIKSNLTASHLFHFHGHADGEQLSQHLQIDNSALSPFPSARGQFGLQDAFTLSIPAAVVLLIACASGTQDIALNDDALGLMTAFFTAGATSIIGTLWPIDSEDGLEFARYFYEESFLEAVGIEGSGEETKGRGLINLAKAHQAAVKKMRRSDNPLCGDDEYERQMDPRDPWRWAGYVLQGSWVCQAHE